MSLIAVCFLVAPEALIRLFTTDAGVVAIGTRLLMIAAGFQLFDGIQVVATGVLRGAGDTRTPVVTNGVGYWVFGIPVGYILCFRLGWGVSGLWLGLTVGLVLVAVLLTIVWTYKTRHLEISARPPVLPDLL